MAVESLLAPKLEPCRNHFILHHALEAHCPLVLAKVLMEVFQNQVHQQDDEGHLPLHVALHSGHAGACISSNPH
jgi:ankyrin repeat protein